MCIAYFSSMSFFYSEVLLDDTQDPPTTPFDVLLSKVDVSHGEYGMYNFYKMQVSTEASMCHVVFFYDLVVTRCDLIS